MRVSLVTVLSGLTAIALAEAIPAPPAAALDAKPRYYFPRVIKRITDDTTNSSSSGTSSSTSSGTDGLLNSLSQLLNPTTTTTVADAGTTTSADAGTTTSADAKTTTGGAAAAANSVAGSLVDDGTTTTTATNTDIVTPPATTTGTTSTPADVTTTTTTPAYITTTTTDLAGSLLGDATSLLTSVLTTTRATSTITALSVTDSVTDAIVTPPTTADTVTTTNVLTTLTSETTTPAFQTTTPTDPGVTGPATGVTTTPFTETTGVVTTTTDTGISFTNTNSGTSASFTGTGASNTGVVTSQTRSDTSASGTPLLSETAALATTTPTTTTTSDDLSLGPQSIKPTATNTDTALSLEPTIVSATSVQPSSGPASIASTIPSSLPRIIQPNGGVPTAPSNGTLIQLGFTYGLNYPFVVSNSWAVQQIFDYLPPGVAHGVGIDKSAVVMQYLQPYNTLSRNGYITTLAMAYIPSEKVNPLSLALLNPKSDLYNNDNPTIKTLVGMLDPSIPLLAGQTIGDGSPINSANAATTSTSGSDGAAAGSGETGSESAVKPSTIGIGLGVVSGAAIYGVAMFMVAKRYKKRRTAHKRASSVQSGSSTGSGPRETNTLMTGARNSYGSRPAGHNVGGRESRNSDRSQHSGRTYISPPVMAENSLGWN